MSDQLPIIVLIAPLFGALLVGLWGMRDHRACYPLVFTALLTSVTAAVAILFRVVNHGAIDYFVGGWEKPLGLGIQLRIDALNAPVLLIITVVALLVSFFSIRRTGEEQAEKTPHFYILFLLLCTGLCGITITADAFNLFVLVEVSSLSSYGLVAMGSNKRGTMAAFHYLLMGTVGASFYLIGVGYLYLKTGSLNMQDFHDILRNNEAIRDSKAITIGFLFMLVGIWIKMAFFPLYGWLPNAYSYAPSSSSSLLAPLMTKVSVYVMLRVMISLFGLEWVFVDLGWSHLVVWLAVVAILAGSLLALGQRELKKMLCYLIVVEVGYMVGGAWLADPNLWGMTGTIYHILADALMTLALFLAAGNFARHLGAVELKDLDGVFRKMPLTSLGFIVAGLAIIGVPPTCGFFSKFYLIRGAIEGDHWEFVVALLVSSLVSAVLFFRIFEIAYFGVKPSDGHGHAHTHEDAYSPEPTQQGRVGDLTLLRREAPLTSLVPLLITGVLIVALGLANGPIVAFIRTFLETLPHGPAL
jgi:multicomponent Na+:H+ antiporter subunit D